MHPLQRHDARLRQPSQYRIAIVKSTDDESLDQTGSCLLTENASHGLQTSKVITYVGNFADVFLHGKLTVPDDAEVANARGGTDDVIPDMQCEVDVSIFFRLASVPNQMTSVFEGFNWRRLDEQHPWMATMHCCSRPMVDPMSSIHVLFNSCVSSAYIIMMTEMESVDESYQIFRIGGEFLGSKNTALGYTALHGVDGTLVFDQ